MKVHSVLIERWDELCACTPNGLASYIDRRVRTPTAYKCSYIKCDGRVSKFYKTVSVVVYPWRSGANHGASVFVVGEGALARDLRRLLRDNLELGRYGVMWLDRPDTPDMRSLISGIWG